MKAVFVPTNINILLANGVVNSGFTFQSIVLSQCLLYCSQKLQHIYLKLCELEDFGQTTKVST